MKGQETPCSLRIQPLPHFVPCWHLPASMNEAALWDKFVGLILYSFRMSFSQGDPLAPHANIPSSLPKEDSDVSDSRADCSTGSSQETYDTWIIGGRPPEVEGEEGMDK